MQPRVSYSSGSTLTIIVWATTAIFVKSQDPCIVVYVSQLQNWNVRIEFFFLFRCSSKFVKTSDNLHMFPFLPCILSSAVTILVSWSAVTSSSEPTLSSNSAMELFPSSPEFSSKLPTRTSRSRLFACRSVMRRIVKIILKLELNRQIWHKIHI